MRRAARRPSRARRECACRPQRPLSANGLVRPNTRVPSDAVYDLITNALNGDALSNAEQPRREVGKPAPLAAGTAAATGSAGARRDCSAAATYTLSRSARRVVKPLAAHTKVPIAVGGGAAERLNIAQVALESVKSQKRAAMAKRRSPHSRDSFWSSYVMGPTPSSI